MANTKETTTYLTTQKKNKQKINPLATILTDKRGNKSQVTLPKGLTKNQDGCGCEVGVGWSCSRGNK